MQKEIKLLLVVLLSSVLVVSCKKDEKKVEDPHSHDEEELITSFKITFKDSAGVLPEYTASFRDLDGPGGNAPIIFDSINLKANTSYYASIILLNETSTPIDTIANEVLKEAADHLICFESNLPKLNIKRTDSDGKYELGLKSFWKTSSPEKGNVIIRLKHQPGVKNGSCDLGGTDIELNFNTEIK